MYKNYNSLGTGRDTWLINGVGGDVGSPPSSSSESTWNTWIVLLITLFLVAPLSTAIAQTTLIDPSAGGGFEAGSTMVANGWNAVNASTDGWIVGSAAGAATGTNAGHVSANGSAWTYSQLSTFTHIYRDVTIPAGESKVVLSFKWKAGGEGSGTSDWDNLKVFVGPTSVTPTTTAAITGATQLSGPGANNGMYKLSSANWNSESITFTGIPGNTYRLIFTWKSDVSDIANPPVALDDISLVTATPGTFASTAAGGLWNAPGTWVGGLVPSSADNAIIADNATVTINAAGLGIGNLTIGEGASGILNYNATATSFTISGNLNVNSGATFNVLEGTNTKALLVSGNITNNGLVNLSAASGTNALVLNGSAVQTIGGTGSFSGSLIRNLTFNNTSSANPNINWNFNNINVGNALIFTNGRVALGSNMLTLGTSVTTVGTLTYGAGGFTSGKFNRYWASTGNGTTISAGVLPTGAGGRYPFISSTNQQRSAFVDRTISPAAGQLSVTYLDATSVTPVAFTDGAAPIEQRFDASWTFSTEGSAYSATSNEIFLSGAGAYTAANQNSRVVMAASAAGGTHQAGTTMPGAQRVMNVAQLTAGALFIGAANADIVQPCSGAPAPGNTISSQASVCAGSTTTLTLQNVVPGTGVTYQWQSATDMAGPWGNIPSATAASYIATVNTATWYRNNVTCDGNTTASNPVQVTMNPFMGCYPAVYASNATEGDIYNVTVGSLNNSSTCATTAPGTGSIKNRYSNYKDLAPIDIARTAIIPFSFNYGTCGTTWYENGFQAYIDFNQNGIFEVSERVYNQPNPSASPTQTVTGSFTVPTNAVLGNTVMRVVNVLHSVFPATINYASTAYTYGETEDYVVNVVEAPACIIPTAPLASNVTFTTADLSWTASVSAPADGYEYATSLSATPPASGTPNEDTTVSVGSLIPESTYYLHVRAVCETDVTFSDWVTTSFQTGYCVSTASPENTATAYTALFQTTGGYSNITNGSTYSANGYNNFTGLAVSGQDGATLNFTVSQNLPGYYYGLSIWVDWNNDLDFEDAGERLYSAPFSNATQTLNGTITIPIATALGNYRMRVRADYINYEGLIPACGNVSYSETEDYTISVVEEPTCFAPTALTVENITEFSADVEWAAPNPVPGIGYEWAVTTSVVPPTAGTSESGTTASVDSLLDNTGYYLHVRAECSEDVFSAWASQFFMTDCASAIIPTPVETFTTLTVPVCWETALVSGSVNWAPMDENDGVPNARTGDYFMGKLYNASNALLISQKVDMTTAGTSGARINVWIYRSADNKANDRIQFHVNTASNLTGATLILEIFPRISSAPAVTSDGWYNYTADIPASYNSETSLYIIAQGTTDGTSTSYGIGFDDFRVENIPSCFSPTNLFATNISDAGASLNWTAPAIAPADGYEYYYSTSDTAPDELTVPSGSVLANTLTVNISGLVASTPHFFWVRSVCSDEDASTWSIMGTFTTACPAASLPFAVETFETEDLPACWTTALVSGTENWATIDANDGVPSARTGDYFMGKEYTNSDALLFTPPFDMTTAGPTGARVSVWIYRSVDNAASDRIRFHVNNQASLSGATQLLQVSGLYSAAPAVAVPGWYNYTVDIPASYNSSTFVYVIAEGMTSAGFSSYGIGFDDFAIDVIPACQVPTNIVATGSFTEATVTYSASPSTPADGYEYEIRSSGAAGSGNAGLENSGNVGAGILTFNSTLPQGDYLVYVRSVCDDDTELYSAWSAGIPVHIGYCIPQTTFGCADGDVIARVVLNTLDNDSGTGCPSDPNPNDDSTVAYAQGPGYSDYTGNPLLTTTLQAGSTYDLTVFSGDFPEGYAAWIDYDDDGIFAANEKVGNSSGQVVANSSATFPIHLACNPEVGQHRLRVRAMYNVGGASVSPCGNNFYGETEDYLITVSAAAACPQPSALSAVQASASSSLLSWTIGCAETLWDVHVQTAGGGAPGGTPSDPGVTMPYEKTGLSSGNSYEFYVRADCEGDGTSVWSGPFAFSITPTADLTSLEGPATITATTDVPFDLRGHVAEAGLTDVVPNIAGQSPGIEFWIGANETNGDPSTWDESSWIAATWDSSVSASYEAYELNVNVGVAGTLYVATRARVGGVTSNFTYGGTNNGTGGNWDGVTFVNAVLITNDPPPLTNDDFADAIAVSCDDIVAGSTEEATNDEPNPAAFGVESTLSPNVWYSFTGTEPQTVTLSLCNSTYDTAILVATGTSGNLTYIAGNDDSDVCGTSRSEVIFNSDGVTTYYIMVRGYSASSTGIFELAVTCAAPCVPAVTNDECISAEALTFGIGLPSNNFCATASDVESPTCGDLFGTHYDTWYTFNTGSETSMRVFLTYVAPVALGFTIYEGACGTLEELECSEDGTMVYVSGLTAATNYFVRVWSLNPAERGEFTIQAGHLPCTFTTTWSAGEWSQGAPGANDMAMIASNYALATDLTACALTVSNNAVVTVPSGFDFNISGAVTVDEGSSLTFANNANLVQDPLAVSNNNSGAITSIRNAMMIRQDYVYWSSPVAGQNLLDFSELTLPNRFYTINEGTGSFVNVAPATNDFAAAAGYVVRAPNTYQPQNPALAGSTAPQLFVGEFNGTPNNGTYTMPVSYSGPGYGFNIMGNPYPSPIDALLFLGSNPGTLYFWTHTNQTPGGASNYATFNGSGGTASAAGGVAPNGFIQTGQGFLLRTGAAGTATFTNEMRVGNNAGQFFRNANTEKHRIWLNLADSSNQLNQILVGYIEGATQGVDQLYDGKMNYTGSSISSALAGDSYVIQGRSLPFANTDVVPLNFKADAAGSYTLSVDHVDGLFLEGQDVFLKDNLLGVVHNIKQTPYTFASEAGSFGDRFQVVYQNVTLGVENPTFDANSVVIYKQENVLQINSGAVMMNNVKVFDIRGRLIYEKNAINANTVSLTDLKAEQQVLLVQITSEDNKMVTRKVAY